MKRINAEKGLNIADLLCSTGYLPPRDEKDLDCFDRFYKGQTFELESYCIDSDTIFDRVAGKDKTKKVVIRPMTTIFDRPSALRVAQNTSEPFDDSVADSLNQLMKDKQDRNDTESI